MHMDTRLSLMTPNFTGGYRLWIVKVVGGVVGGVVGVVGVVAGGVGVVGGVVGVIFMPRNRSELVTGVDLSIP